MFDIEPSYWNLGINSSNKLEVEGIEIEGLIEEFGSPLSVMVKKISESGGVTIYSLSILNWYLMMLSC